MNNAYRDGKILSVIDEQMGAYPSECVEKFVTLALRCCRDETDARPSMVEVVRELEEIWRMIPESENKIKESQSQMSINLHSTDTSPSSSLPIKHPYASTDVSGSDLISGMLPNIAPR